MAEPVFASPIPDTSAPTGALTLTDQSALTKVTVRAAADTAAGAAMAVPFGQSRRTRDVLIAGIRPDEWWLIGDRSAVHREVSPGEMPGFAHAIDLTHGRLCVRLTGPDAARALEKVCSLDLSDPITPDGAATSASVAEVSCDLVRDDVEGMRSYLILADRSYGQYLFDALADACAEF